MSNIKNKETRKVIRKMKADGWGNRAIGRELGIPESSIRYFLKQQGELQYDPEDVAFKSDLEVKIIPSYVLPKGVFSVKDKPKKILVIADTQCKPSVAAAGAGATDAAACRLAALPGWRLPVTAGADEGGGEAAAIWTGLRLGPSWPPGKRPKCAAAACCAGLSRSIWVR